MTASLSSVSVVFGREFRAYFATPLAAIFLVVFLALAGAMTFFVSGFGTWSTLYAILCCPFVVHKRSE